jgi:hypothetical protein
MSGKRIVLVGHCGPDSYALRSALSRMIPAAAAVCAGDDRALERELPTADLLLVNRLLDGDYREESGIALIRRLAAAGTRPALMLISNVPEAQAQAVEAGALLGFGKRDLYSEETAAKLRAAVGDPDATASAPA